MAIKRPFNDVLCQQAIHIGIQYVCTIYPGLSPYFYMSLIKYVLKTVLEIVSAISSLAVIPSKSLWSLMSQSIVNKNYKHLVISLQHTLSQPAVKTPILIIPIKRGCNSQVPAVGKGWLRRNWKSI